MTEYYNFPYTAAVDPSDLQLERSSSILRAVLRDPDCKLIECRRGEDNAREIIVLDLETHGIPTRSPVDIRFSERIAFVVYRDPRRYVAALMLRKDFPTMLHQNQTSPNSPRDLCLHYEPRETVLRTWTPQRFIRRVKWWLAASSTGTLHGQDQSPETLFFDSNDELVVPPNFDQLVEQGSKFGFTISESIPGW